VTSKTSELEKSENDLQTSLEAASKNVSMIAYGFSAVFIVCFLPVLCLAKISFSLKMS